MILILGTFSWGTAQGLRTDLFDARKSEQELEIMKGILGTTLEFVSHELQSDMPKASTKPRAFAVGRWMRSNVEGFYLFGQGATFVIPVSGLRVGLSKFKEFGLLDVGEFKAAPVVALHSLEAEEEALHAAQAQVEEQAAQLEEMARAQSEYQRALQEHQAALAAAQAPQPTPAPAPPAAVAPPAAPARPQPADREKVVRRKLVEAQEQVKKRREEAEELRKKMQDTLEQIKVHLIEALANHGDSLTQVRPNEYINIVITTDGGESILFDSTAGRMDNDIISVQKSVITDYKAGRLSLDAFKQKVLNYRS
jgi:hypothetical protein